jgi:hypothetical protein
VTKYAFGEWPIWVIEIGFAERRLLYFARTEKDPLDPSTNERNTMSFISAVLVKTFEKISATKQATDAKRTAVINRLCDTLGTEYRGLKQYRGL